MGEMVNSIAFRSLAERLTHVCFCNCKAISSF